MSLATRRWTDAELRQYGLEEEARQLAAGRYDGSGWLAAPAQFVVSREGGDLVQHFATVVANAHKQPGYMGEVLARIPDQDTARGIAADAMLHILSRVGDGFDRADLARKVGMRAECALLLNHPKIRRSWHRRGLIQMAACNATIHDLLYRLRNLKILQAYRPMTTKQKAALGVLIIDMVVHTGVIEYHAGRAQSGGWITKVRLSERYRTFTDDWREVALRSVAGRWPMVCPPKPWTSAVDGGYLSQQEALITGGHVVFDHATRECRDDILRVLNRLQGQAVALNPAMLAMFHDAWQLGQQLGSMPTRVPLPRPESTWQTRVTRAYWRQVIAANADRKNQSMRSMTAQSLMLAERLLAEPDERLWRPVHLDSRGRIYYRSRLSLQQPDHLRSMLRWPAGTGDNRLQVGGRWNWFAWQLQGHYGTKQTTLEDAGCWMVDYWVDLVQLGRDARTDSQVVRDCKEPWATAAMCMELDDANASDSHQVRHMMRLDQTCSGYGHVAAMTWDARLARATNLLGDSKHDLYAAMLERARRAVDRALVEAATEKQIKTFERMQRIGFDRALIKETCMPLVYGSSRWSMRTRLFQAYKGLLGNVVDDQGVRVSDLANAAATLIYRAGKEELTHLAGLGGWLRQLAQLQMDAGMVVHWWTPDGMRVHCYRRSGTDTRIELVNHGGRRMFVKVMLHEEDGDLKIDRTKTLRGVAPDFIHSMDAYFLRRAADTWDGPLEVVHDCFATDLCRVEALNRHLRQTFAEVYEADPLHQLWLRAKDELGARGEELPPPPRAGDEPLQGIGENLYLFC